MDPKVRKELVEIRDRLNELLETPSPVIFGGNTFYHKSGNLYEDEFGAELQVLPGKQSDAEPWDKGGSGVINCGTDDGVGVHLHFESNPWDNKPGEGQIPMKTMQEYLDSTNEKWDIMTMDMDGTFVLWDFGRVKPTHVFESGLSLSARDVVWDGIGEEDFTTLDKNASTDRIIKPEDWKEAIVYRSNRFE